MVFIHDAQKIIELTRTRQLKRDSAVFFALISQADWKTGQIHVSQAQLAEMTDQNQQTSAQRSDDSASTIWSENQSGPRSRPLLRHQPIRRELCKEQARGLWQKFQEACRSVG